MLGALNTQSATLKLKHGNGFQEEYGWAKPDLAGKPANFAMIEEAVTLSFMRPYYKFASEQIHASARGAVLRWGLMEHKPWQAELLIGPSDYGFADAAEKSVNALLLATISLVQVAPSADTNVTSMILTRWSAPLRRSFVLTQVKMDKRFRAKRRRGSGVS